MGQQQSSTMKTNRTIKIKKKLTLKTHLRSPVICPYCNQEFSHKATYSSLNEHLYKCGNSSKGESTKQDSADISDNDFQLVIDYTADHYNSPNNNALKQESQMKETSSLTEKQKMRLLFLNFDAKYAYFKNQINKLHTGEQSKLTSLEQLVEVNLYNNISYKNGDISVPLQSLFNIYTDEMLKTGSLSLNKNKRLNITSKTSIFDATLLGVIIAKSIINNYPLKYKLSPLLIKIIFDLGLQLEDIKTFEPGLYSSLKKLKEIEHIDKKTQMCYIVEKADDKGKIVKDELLFGGEKIKVTNDNIGDYIDKRIKYELKKYNETLFHIKRKIFDNISKTLFSVFTFGELEKIVCGKV